MPTSTISNTIPTISPDFILETVASFLTNPLPPGQKTLTLFPVPSLIYNTLFGFLHFAFLGNNHPLLRLVPQHLLRAFRCKYTYSTHTLIVKHPDTRISLGRALLGFVAYGLKDALQASGILTRSELDQVHITHDELYRLENFGWKKADLAFLHIHRSEWIPHIVFEVGMGQRYEAVKSDVRDWLVASRGEVKLGVLVYYEEGEVPDSGRSASGGLLSPLLIQDGYIPPIESPPLIYFFETYRYDPITGDIKLAQERTYLFRDGEKMTPEPMLELARWDFGLPGRKDVNGDGDGDNSSDGWDWEGGDDTMGTGDQDNESKNVCRIPLGRLQYWIEYGKFPDT